MGDFGVTAEMVAGVEEAEYQELYEICEDNQLEADQLGERLVMRHASLEATIEAQYAQNGHCDGDGSEDLNLENISMIESESQSGLLTQMCPKWTLLEVKQYVPVAWEASWAMNRIVLTTQYKNTTDHMYLNQERLPPATGSPLRDCCSVTAKKASWWATSGTT